MNAVTSTETRALELLGQGIAQEQVALALGVTPSAISQLMAREDFAGRVQTLRYENLQKHNQRDAKLDQLEDSVIEKLTEMLPLVMKPLEAARILQVTNAAKRRGASAPEEIINTREIVNLTLPVTLVNNFRLIQTSDGQVVSAGEKDLVTIQSARLPALITQSERQGDKNGGDQQKRIAVDSASKSKPVYSTDF